MKNFWMALFCFSVWIASTPLARADQTITGDVTGGDIVRQSDGINGEMVTVTAKPGESLNISGGNFSTVSPQIYTNGVVTTRDDNIRLYNAAAGPDPETGLYHMHTAESVEQAYKDGNTAQFAPANNPQAIPSKEEVLKALSAAENMGKAMRVNAWNITADGNINVTGGNFDFTTPNISRITANGKLNWSGANLLSSGGGGAMMITAKEGIDMASGSIRSVGYGQDGPYVIQYDNRGRLNRDRWTLGNYIYFMTDGDIVLGKVGSSASPEIYVGDGMVFFTNATGGTAPGNFYINSGSLTLEGKYRSTLNTGSMAQTIINGGELNVITSDAINRNGVDSATMYLGDTTLNAGAINLYNGQMGGAVVMNGGVINAAGDSAINSGAKTVTINGGVVNLGPKSFIGAIKGDSLEISPYVTSAAGVTIGAKATVNLELGAPAADGYTPGKNIGGIYTINGGNATSITIANGARFNILNPYGAGVGETLIANFAEADNGVVNVGEDVSARINPWYSVALLKSGDNTIDMVLNANDPAVVVAGLPGNDNLHDNAGAFGSLILNGAGAWGAFAAAVVDATPEESAEMLRQAGGESVTANAYQAMSAVKQMEKAARDHGFGDYGLSASQNTQWLDNGNRLWINGVGVTASQQSRGGITGNWNESAGFVAGFDHAFSENFLAGIALGYTRGYFESNDSLVKGHSNNWYASIYGSCKWNQLALDGDVFYAYTDTDIDTNINGWSSSSDSIGASSIGASLLASYAFEFNEGLTRLSPYVGIEYVGINQYGWSSGGYLPRDFDDDFATLWTLPVGVRFSHDFVGDDWAFNISLGAGYARDLNEFRPEAKVSIPGVRQTIDSKGPKWDMDSFRGDAALTFTKDSLSVYLQYNLDARSHYTSHGGTLGVAWTF